MTDLFGSYRSQTTRGLQQINSTKYPDTNKDFEKNIQRLNQFVDYISQYLQTMQKGVDEANQDPISKMRSTITDLAVLLGGGELLYGINLGDLQYYLPALGAMFGFDSAQPFPLNLLYAAEHFFLGYIVPLDSWAPAIEDIIDSWAVAFGIPADFVASLHDVLDALQSITSDYLGLFNALWGILTIFDTLPGVDQGPFADLWHAISTLLGGANLSSLGALADPIFHGLAPWIEELANLLSLFDQVLQAFTGGIVDITGIVNLGNMFTPYINLLSGFTTPAAAWTSVFTSALTAGVIPNIDASKIISGTFLQSLIPGLTSGWGKTIDASLILGAVATATSVAVSGITGLATGIASWLGSGGALPAASTATASQIISGIFSTGLIPNIDASKVTTGILNLLQIPNMSTAKITSGTFLSSFLPMFGFMQGAGSNLVPDPSFEYGPAWAPVLNANVQIVTTRAHTGTHSLKVTGTQAVVLSVNDAGGIQLKTRPGEVFRWAGWVWGEAANAGTGQVLSTINWYAADGVSFIQQTNSANYATLTKGQWNYIEVMHTAPANCYWFYPYFYTPGVPATDVYYLDDILIREETQPQSIIQRLFGGTNVLTSILAGVVPNLDASKIVTGVLNLLQIPNLPAGQITSGTFLQSLIPSLTSGWGGTILSSFLSGVLGSGLIPNIDASKIISGVLNGTLIPQLPITQVNTLPGLLSTMFSPFNPPQAIGPGQITAAPQNLLKNWNFPDATSMAGETVWVWDSATNAAPGGSAKVNVAVNTNIKALQSDPIQVAAKDTINTSAWTQWSGLTYTGTPINLMLNLYDASNALISQVTLATATMTGATSSWVQIAGAYTIPDASTAVWARLVYAVGTTATAGSVWFTNGSLTKPNPIPQAAVQDLTGILGAANVGQTIQDFLDKGIQGIVNDPGTLVNQSIATFNQQISALARFLGFVNSGAAPPQSVAAIASNVDATVKARAVQKAFNENIDPTTDATFPLSQVWQNATLPTVAATAGATVIGDITIRDGGDKNAVTWYGYPTGGNFGSITDFRVNVYSINKTTNVRTKVHGSINLIGSATPPGTGSAPVFNSYNLPASIQNTPGDRLSAEIAILGAGTYNVVGQTISSQIPFHSVYGLHGLTRASATAPTTMNPPGVGGSPLSYSRAIPWIGMSGVQSATQYTPVIIPYYSSDSFNPAIYQWANYMDIAVCGPGGRGADGSGYWGGFAGHPGGWGSYAGIPKSAWGAVTTSVSVTAGQSQTASSVTIPGWGTIYGGAGANEAGVSATSNLGAPGGGPGDTVVNDIFYPGGNGGATAQAGGGRPGGAGAGGNAPWTVGTNIYGGPGGDGIAYLRLYQ